jgi:tetratricopeptide (TPR) repeat protein
MTMKTSTSLASSLCIVCLAMLFNLSQVEACMWIHGTTIHGHFVSKEGELDSNYLAYMKNEKIVDIKSLFRDYVYDHSNPVGEANDKAVQTLLLGNASKAVEMLEKIEHENPGFYYTAANLGTAYELAGNDSKALEWILEGIRRNPESHMKTEWLHARILEAKIKLQEQPDWFKTTTITMIELDRINEADYEISTAQGIQNMGDVRFALYEQLSVRMLLVKPRDGIVAQLLIELAHLEHILGFQESTIGILNLAINYGESEATVSALRKKAESVIKGTIFSRLKKKIRPYIKRIIVAGSILGLIIIFIWRITRRLLKAQRGKAPQSLPASESVD